MDTTSSIADSAQASRTASPRAVRPSTAARGSSVLIVPGLGGSGPQHWQSVWQARYPELRRVEQASWDEPRLGPWVATLEAHVLAANAPVVLVAHSLGCLLVALYYQRLMKKYN